MGSRLRDRTRRHDAFFRQAKKHDYAARAVYKLEQIDQRFRLLRPGHRVLDLGCRPGSWMQYAARTVGPKGLVVGLDRQPLGIEIGPNARSMVGDVMTIDPSELRGSVSCFHAVLSDMAPDTTGISFADQVRSMGLFMRAFELSLQLGCPGSSFVGKLFMGEGFDQAMARIKQAYSRTKTIRPDATRKESKELYVVAMQRK